MFGKASAGTLLRWPHFTPTMDNGHPAVTNDLAQTHQVFLFTIRVGAAWVGKLPILSHQWPTSRTHVIDELNPERNVQAGPWFFSFSAAQEAVEPAINAGVWEETRYAMASPCGDGIVLPTVRMTGNYSRINPI